MNSIKLILQKILDLVKEIEVYEYYKENLIDTLENIHAKYLNAEIDFSTYERMLREILKEKSKTELIRYYNSYIYYLLKKIDFYNSQIFYIAYHDELYKNMALPPQVKKQLDALRKDISDKEKNLSFIEKIEDKKSNVLKPGSTAFDKKNKKKLSELERELLSENVENSENSKTINKIFIKLQKIGSVILDSLLLKDTSRKKSISLSSKTEEFQKKLESERKALQTSTYDEDFEKKLEVELNKDSLKNEKKKSNPKILIKEESAIGKRSFDSVYDKMKGDFEMLVPKPLSLDKEPDIPSPTKHTIVKFISSQFESLNILLGLKKEKNEIYDDLKKLGLPSEGEYNSLISKVSTKEGRKTKTKGAEFFDRLLEKPDEDEDIISNETKIGGSLISVASKDYGSLKETATDSESALMKEAHHMKLLLDSQDLERRRSDNFWERYNLIDRLLNIYVKKFSLKFIETFPGLFKNLYDYLRFADIKMLSNTYVNIMIFSTVISMLVSFPLLLLYFFFSGMFILRVFVSAFFWSIVMGAVTFLVIYNYPSYKIKGRRRSMNSNMPFAINHMSAVAASGVPPTTMFKLIAMSDEYGEISKEIQKVSDYINVFGYDVLTAVKQVSSSTPSRQMKEFLDGFVATVETGGDLVNYLKQKSDETMLSYNLERQKYNETIGTYSDIYTGIMIAAPLFFMSTLSIVNLMGGQVGTMDVNAILAYAIYLFIPLINVGFLLFVHYNQPEI